jgi:hypothetical protein
VEGPSGLIGDPQQEGEEGVGLQSPSAAGLLTPAHVVLAELVGDPRHRAEQRLRELRGDVAGQLEVAVVPTTGPDARQRLAQDRARFAGDLLDGLVGQRRASRRPVPGAAGMP